MPERLVLIRHGESEANLLHRAIRKGVIDQYPEGFSEIPDREIRLSPLGRKQAESTGEWLASQYPKGFDVIFVSDHVRARETAGIILKTAGWEDVQVRIDPLLGERNWGRYTEVHRDIQQRIREELKRDPLHTSMPDGESLLHTRQRTRTLLERVAREYGEKRVLIFSHGEYIEAIWAEIEHMRSERQREFFQSSAGDIKNCQVVEFSCSRPGSPESDGKLRWVRSSCPQQKIEREWKALQRETYTPEELLAGVDHYPHLKLPSLDTA